ncbi:MAG: hypothetical protein IKN04_16765 [Clostridia bacterium]|nr:hypothetical protein [Clostridia bacterium]
MNTFANSLFSVLFGWARGLIRRLWDNAVSGQFSGFFIWLGDHWLWVVLGLILGCTVMDYLIWLIRWRPYLLWRAFFRRVRRLSHRENRQFKRGYQSSVAIQVTPDREQDAQEDAWAEEAWAQPQPPAEEEPALEPIFSASMEKEPRARQFTPPQTYEAPPLFASARQVTGSFSAEMPVARRRRRSEKYERRRQEWRDRLINGDAQDYEMLDGLPPVVDRQQAFHEPVYPRQNTGGDDAYSAWQRPAGGSGNTNG